MDKYIERERAEIIFRDARLALKPEGCKGWNEYITLNMMLMIAEQAIHIIPAADVVPVVRCKDCSFSKDGGYFCTHPMGLKYAMPNYFCFHGDRRE